MSDAGKQQLAILGGAKAVTVKPAENWPVPKAAIKDAVCALIDKGIYTETGTGTTAALEHRFARYTGAKHCLAQNNGTSTLWAAYYALGIGPGDEVLHPAYTWLASISPAVHLGAKPVFCEVSPENLTIDPADLERRITPRSRAVTVVHMHGNVCDMESIMAIAGKHGLAVIEDCSHAHGAEWDGKKVGTIGDVGCFSMQGGVPFGKPLPAGEGGLVITNRRDLYERMLLFGHLNRSGIEGQLSDPELRRLAPTNVGIKFRPHPWAMALAMIMLDNLDERNEKRRRYRRKVLEALSAFPGIESVRDHPKSVPGGFYEGMHLLFQPQELGGLSLEDFLAALRAEGVVDVVAGRQAGLTHRLSLYAEGYDIYGNRGPLTEDYPGYPAGSLPVTEDVHSRLFYLSTYIEETPGYSDQLIAAFEKVTAQYSSLQSPKGQRRLRAHNVKGDVRRKARGLIRKLIRPRR